MAVVRAERDRCFCFILFRGFSLGKFICQTTQRGFPEHPQLQHHYQGSPRTWAEGTDPPGSWTSLDALVPPTRWLLPPGVVAAAEPCFAAGAAKPRRRAGSPCSAAVYRHFQVFVTPACTSQPFKLCCNFLLRLFDSCTTSLFYNKITLKCYWDAHWNIYSLLGNLASEMQAHENDGSDARSPLHSLASWRKGKKKRRYLKSKWPGEGEAAVSTWLSS